MKEHTRNTQDDPLGRPSTSDRIQAQFDKIQALRPQLPERPVQTITVVPGPNFERVLLEDGSWCEGPTEVNLPSLWIARRLKDGDLQEYVPPPRVREKDQKQQQVKPVETNPARRPQTPPAQPAQPTQQPPANPQVVVTTTN